MDQEKEKNKNENSFLLLKAADEDEDEEDIDYLDSLPPGYRFLPTDEELVTDYLKKKLLDMPLPPNKFKEENIYMNCPEQIFDKYNEDKENGVMYFFTPRDRKYPKGNRPNRVIDGNGYWKASGKAENVIGKEGITIGYKRSLVYYMGSPKSSVKTNWLMHEYTLDHSSTPSTSRDPCDKKLDKWVLCRVYKKNKQSEQEEENEVDAATIGEIRELQMMQGVNSNVFGQICHASSSQMPNYRNHAMSSGSRSQMPPIYNSGQDRFSMPRCPSQMMQIPNYNMFTHLRPTMLAASSSRMPVYNNNGQNSFLPQRMQSANYNATADQLSTTVHSREMCGTSSSQMSAYHHNGQNNFSSSSRASACPENGQNGFPSSSQMSFYHHNRQNHFPMPEDHLILNNVGYGKPNPPEQNNGMDYRIDVPGEQTGCYCFTVLNEEELKPLDYKGNDNRKPGQGGI